MAASPERGSRNSSTQERDFSIPDGSQSPFRLPFCLPEVARLNYDYLSVGVVRNDFRKIPLSLEGSGKSLFRVHRDAGW